MARPYGEVVTQERFAPGSDLERFSAAAQAHFEAAYQEDFGLGETVAKRRAELHLSQTQLAERTGVTQADISRIERGKGNPTLDTLKKLLLVLQLQMSLQPHFKDKWDC